MKTLEEIKAALSNPYLSEDDRNALNLQRDKLEEKRTAERIAERDRAAEAKAKADDEMRRRIAARRADPASAQFEAEEVRDRCTAQVAAARQQETNAEVALRQKEVAIQTLNGRLVQLSEKKKATTGDARKPLLLEIAAAQLERDDALEERDAAKLALDKVRETLAAALTAERKTASDAKWWAAAIVSKNARERVQTMLFELAGDFLEIDALISEAFELHREQRPPLFGHRAVGTEAKAIADLPEYAARFGAIQRAPTPEERRIAACGEPKLPIGVRVGRAKSATRDEQKTSAK